MFKGSEMESELGEAFGASEETGNFVAKAIVDDQMAEIKKKKMMLSDTSQVTGQGSGVSGNTNTPASAMSKKFAPDLFAVANKSQIEEDFKQAEALEKRLIED